MRLVRKRCKLVLILIVVFPLVLLSINYQQFLLDQLFLFTDFQPIYHPNPTSSENSFPRVLRSPCHCRQDKEYVIYNQKKQIRVSEISRNSSKQTLFNYSEDEFRNITITCNLYNAFRRGAKQSVISYSLYGNDSYYFEKIPFIAKQIKRLFPGWIMRIYHDKTLSEKVKCSLECAKHSESSDLIDNIDFCAVETLPMPGSRWQEFDYSYLHSMAWRWLPVGDNFVTRFMSRDTDSAIIQREKDAIDVWIESGKAGHIMRDNPMHNVAMLGGLWGFYNDHYREIAEMIFLKVIKRNVAEYYNTPRNKKNRDQNFLAYYIYPLMKHNSVQHDSYNCGMFSESIPFPSRRRGRCFVGESFGEIDCVKAGEFIECPLRCRPIEHPKWTTC